MDLDRLDRLARSAAAASPRRRVLGLLACLPVAGGLLTLLDAEDALGKDRRRRRKQRHKRRKSPGGHKHKGCKPKSKSVVCAGTCGPVKSKQTCGKTVDCGPCDCPQPCDACFTCDPATRTCVVDSAQVGKPCGSTGQVCAGDGACACDATSCPACQACGGDGTCGGCDGCCDGDTCVADCGACQVCDDGQCRACPGCCDTSGVCQSGDTNAACGQPGATCAVCTSPQTCGGGGQEGECGCTATTCVAQGKNCGTISDGCGGTLPCGTCGGTTPICTDNVCVACPSDGQCGSGAVCCGGGCFSGVCCGDSACDDPAAPDCVAHQCTCASNGDAPCTGGDACCDDGCADLETDPDHCGDCETACANPTPICAGGSCAACTSHSQCGSNRICVEGACRGCDVTCTGTPVECGTALKAAFAGSDETIYVCPGIYQPTSPTPSYDGFSISRAVTVIGAGDGDDPTTNTILDGNRERQVLDISGGPVTLEHLRVTRGTRSGDGAGIGLRSATLHVRACTIIDNHTISGGDGGGGIASTGLPATASLTLTDCLVAGNSARHGGGIALFPDSITVLDGQTIIRGNTATSGGGIDATFSTLDTLRIGADCRITGNTATGGSGDGGGIFTTSSTAVTLDGPDPSPIVVDNCHENCAIPGFVAKCQSGGTCPA